MGMRSRDGQEGRRLGRLLADFGHRIPPPAKTSPASPEPDPFPVLVGRRGRRGAAAGWCPVPAPLAVYRMTSEQTPACWPLINGDGLPPTGAQIGVDYLTGGAFYADPIGWTLDDAVPGVTNPNIIVFGAPGHAKSGTVKMFCLRMMPYGYRTLILGDPKDEYEPLCRALGVPPHAVGPGLPARINPFDHGPDGGDWSLLSREAAQQRAAGVFARWSRLTKGLVGSQGVPFDATAEEVTDQALCELTGYATGADRMSPITVPQLWHALHEPSPELVEDTRYSSRQHFLDDTPAVRDALARLVHGHLAGLFDAHTTIAVDWDAPIQSLSLSRLNPLGDEALGVALTCLNSWGQAMTQRAAPGDLRIVVRDECWKQMRLGPEAVKSLDADLRFSRSEGTVQIVIAHKPSDPLTVGNAGSQEVEIAKDLLHLCATKVLFGQDERIGDDLSRLLGLSPLAGDLVTRWAAAGKGRALWLVGGYPAKVETIRTGLEEALTDTNRQLQST